MANAHKEHFSRIVPNDTLPNSKECMDTNLSIIQELLSSILFKGSEHDLETECEAFFSDLKNYDGFDFMTLGGPLDPTLIKSVENEFDDDSWDAIIVEKPLLNGLRVEEESQTWFWKMFWLQLTHLPLL